MSKMTNSKTDIRYDTSAIQFMDHERNRFYDLWLGLATEHALEAHRNRVLKEDLHATRNDAVKKLLEAPSAEDETSRG